MAFQMEESYEKEIFAMVSYGYCLHSCSTFNYEEDLDI